MASPPARGGCAAGRACSTRSDEGARRRLLDASPRRHRGSAALAAPTTSRCLRVRSHHTAVRKCVRPRWLPRLSDGATAAGRDRDCRHRLERAHRSQQRPRQLALQPLRRRTEHACRLRADRRRQSAPLRSPPNRSDGGALYAPFVVFVVVATGNHFFFDAATGALVVVVAAATAASLTRHAAPNRIGELRVRRSSAPRTRNARPDHPTPRRLSPDAPLVRRLDEINLQGGTDESDNRFERGTEALAGTGGDRGRAVHGHRRRRGRERRLAGDQARPSFLPGEPAVGDHRLLDRVRRDAAPGRASGRPPRTQAAVHDGCRRVHA